jgi:hypothetical protein
MDPPLRPPLRIEVGLSQPVSKKYTIPVLSSFLDEYQAREGDGAVIAQMQKLIQALEEEEKARKSKPT